MTTSWLRGLAVFGATVTAATTFANPALATSPPRPGMQVDAQNSRCTAGFAAQGNDGSYYLFTSGHCDAHDDSEWTYGNAVPLGRITASEHEGDTVDAAIIHLDPSVGAPVGNVGGKYIVRDVLSPMQVERGMPFCKIGAVSGETCGWSKTSRTTWCWPASTAPTATAAVPVS